MAKITYEDKEFLNKNENIADKNKVNDTDLNEIKNIINQNDDNIGTLSNLNTTDKTSLVNAINEVNNKSAITVKCASTMTYNSQNADVAVNFTDVSLQKGSNLSYSNGIFTAKKPMTVAVSYYFNNASNSGEMVPIIRIWKNNTQVHQGGITLRVNSGNDPLTIANFLIDLEEGDTVKITYNRNNGNGALRSNSYITLIEI